MDFDTIARFRKPADHWLKLCGALALMITGAKQKNSSNRFLALAAIGVLSSVSANADLIHPHLLKNSVDGAANNVQSLINSTAGVSANVGSLNGSNAPTSYGDQIGDRLFQMCDPQGSMTWSIKWQSAGFAARHRVGWYRPGDHNTITWIIGGSATALPSSFAHAVSGIFGIVLDSGNNGANTGNGGNTQNNRYFWSEKLLNSDSLIGSSSVPSLVGFDRREHCSVLTNTDVDCGLVVTWEDLKNSNPAADGGHMDYNDLGLSLEATSAVPEPATMTALGLGIAAIVRRRRKN